MEWIRFAVAALLILGGLAMELIAVFGVNRFRFVLNRLHAAAIGDTVAIGLVLLGVIVLRGFSFVSLKLFAVVLFLWMASAVSSHMLCRLEVTIDEQAVASIPEVEQR